MGNLEALTQQRAQLQQQLESQSKAAETAQLTVESTSSKLTALDSQIRAIEEAEAEKQRISQLDAANLEARKLAVAINHEVDQLIQTYGKLMQLLPEIGVTTHLHPATLESLPAIQFDSQSFYVFAIGQLPAEERRSLPKF